MKIGSHFQFEPPSGWAETRDGGRLIFRGPAGEELIVSSWVINGLMDDSDFGRAEDRLLERGLAVVQQALRNPELVTIKPLSNVPALCSLPCWYAISHSSDSTLYFYQAVVRTSGATMLVTLESPPVPESFRTFSSFLAGIRPVADRPA